MSLLPPKLRTSLPSWAWIRRVWVSVVVNDIFGNIISRQLGHKVGDVSKGTEELQALVSATLWKNIAITQSKP